MKRYLCVVLFSLISALSFGVVLPVTIDSASINYTANTITVTGQGFCANSKLPTVIFNLTQLKLVTTVCSNTSVVANLPAQAQGSYKLTVTNGSAGSTTFEVTYGAVGPQGPIGLTGASGATGAAGPTGATGQQGLTGATGATGPQGPIGLTGAIGAAGPAGSQGPQGVQGSVGPAGASGIPPGTWSYVASLPTATDGPGAVLNGQFVVAGYPSANVESYNSTTNTWTTLTTLPITVNYASAAVINGQLYIVGGCVNSDCGARVTNQVEIYNPTTNSWSNASPMLTPVASAATAVINGLLYVAGGATSDYRTVSTLQVYDPVANQWTSLASMPTGINGGGGAAINGNLYVLGGAQSSGVLPVSIYNPSTNTWSQGVSTIPVPTWEGPAVVVMNGFAYVIGGSNSSGLTNAVQAYNPISDTWTSLSPLDAARNMPAAAVVGGVIYIAGGTQAGSYVATSESFYQYPAGPQGPAGPIGPTGTPGPQGPLGLTGATGAAGAAGPQGPVGLTGATGSAGPQGPAGLTGATGQQGAQGAAGTNGTGFNFRGAFNTSTAYAMNDVATYAPGANNVTYNVNLTFGSAGSMVGTITTDGTLGALNTSNIVSWNLTLADSATNSTLLTPGNSAFSSGSYNTGGQPNNDFTATSTTLTMTYSNGGFWSVSGASGQFCMTDWSNCFGPIAYGTWGINGDNASSDSAVGAGSSQIIGTGGTVATPLTSTYVATAPVAAGTALPGTLPWAMMAQAGTNGINGLNGAVGPQGPMGLSITGPQGPQGIEGLPGLTGPAGPAGPRDRPDPRAQLGRKGHRVKVRLLRGM